MALAVELLKIRNCGCIQEALLELGALHALIGPNDSGKSTVLRAARTAVHFASGDVIHMADGGDRGEPFDPQLKKEDEPYLAIEFGKPAEEFGYDLT
jgi:hypothetical protein